MERDINMGRVLLALLIAVLAATWWGALVQTQYNLAALRGIGADIGMGVVVSTSARDIASGFTPTYGGYVVLPALLVAFLVAHLIVRRTQAAPYPWFIAGATLALLVAIPLVNWLAPVALLVGASRDWSCTVLMALGGVLSGWLFVWLSNIYPRRRAVPQTPVR